MNKRKFNITGMSCAACSARVERAVSGLAGVSSCSVNLLTSSMTVEGEASTEEIISAVVLAGYGASEISKVESNVNNKLQIINKSSAMRRLIPSAILMVILMYFSMGYVMWGAPLPAALGDNPIVVALIQCALSGAVMLINRRYFINGALGVVRRSPNMDTLVALGSSVSFLYGVFAIVVIALEKDVHVYAHNLYFEGYGLFL